MNARTLTVDGLAFDVRESAQRRTIEIVQAPAASIPS